MKGGLATNDDLKTNGQPDMRGKLRQPRHGGNGQVLTSQLTGRNREMGKERGRIEGARKE